MKQILLLCFFAAFTSVAFAQAAGDYQSNSNNGNWSTLATWQRWSGSAWVTPTAGQGYPGQFTGTGAVTITGSDQITLNVSPANPLASLTVGNGSGTNESLNFNGAGFTLTVTGDVVLDDGNIVMTNAAGTNHHTLNVGGNFTVGSSSSFTAVNSSDDLTVVLNGTGTQTIGGTIATITFENLTINKASGSASLGTDADIDGTMTFTSGILTTSTTNLLTINNGATVTGASDASFVDGPVRRDGNSSFTFPVGATGAGYHGIGVSGISGGGGAAAGFQAQYFRTDPHTVAAISGGSSINSLSNCEYWTMSRVASTRTANVTLFWNYTASNGGCAYTPAGSQVCNLNGSNQWNNIGNTVTGGSTTAAGSVATTVAVTSFNSFAIGNGTGAASLPVTFGKINASVKNNGIQVDWSILTEVNVDHYEIERSADGRSFQPVGQVAARNLPGALSYSFYDATPNMGYNYYRIVNIDRDGKYSYSPIARISMSKTGKDLGVFPNPVKGTSFTLVTPDLKKGTYTVNIVNAAGQEVYRKNYEFNAGVTSQTLQLPSTVKPGIYSVQITGSDARMVKSFVVQ